MRLLLFVFTFHLLRTCESVKRCSMPEKPENGNFYFTTKRENKIGGFVKFTCDPGFDLNGQKQIKCLKSTKNWATEFPTCEIGVRCPTIPTTLLNGFVRIEPGEMVVGKQVTFTCRRGYYLPKFSQRLIECQQDGTWTDDVPECVKSGCQLPEVDIENGFVIDARNGTYLANDPLYYGCDDGYKIRGSWQVCKPSKGTSGKWDGDVPRCEFVRCSQLPILENGRKVGNDVNVGAIVKFFCSSGYELEGPNQRECLEDGRWSRGDPVCIRKGNPSHCVPLPIPINGQKSGTRYDLYDVVTFTCDSGYTLIGSKLRRCLETGWSGERTTCEGSDEYSDIEEVKDSFIQNFDALKTVTYTNPEVEARIEQEREAACNESAGENCQTGRLIDLNYEGRLEIYFVFDASQSVGQENFDISIDFAKAVVTKLGVGTKEKGPRYGFVVYSNDATVVLHTTEPVDTVGAVHERLNTIEYEGRGTNTFAGLNALYVQVIPLSVNNLPPTDATPQRAVFLLTDGESNTGGAPFDIANKLRAEFSAKIHCIGISESVNKDELVELASTPTREYYFHLKDYVSLEELAYAISNEEYDYSPCGIGGSNVQRSGRIIGGTEANPGAWPWQVAFYDNEQDDVFCGGTLISNEWILTAAHCFDQDPGPNSKMGKDWKTTTPYMGLTDREKDKKSSNTSRIIDLITHSLYNNKESPNYDYDVALAKIEPIRLHPQVRTVCLPGVTDTNLEEEYSLEGKLNKIEYVTVTGWGRLGFKKEKATKLQQLDLPLGIYDKCRESLDGAGDEFTHRMFCAGGEAGKDSCSGDSGGPVVQKRTNNGEERYEVVGIVSWGQADCGQEGEYGFYTHVPRLLDWIKKKTGLQ